MNVTSTTAYTAEGTVGAGAPTLLQRPHASTVLAAGADLSLPACSRIPSFGGGLVSP